MDYPMYVIKTIHHDLYVQEDTDDPYYKGVAMMSYDPQRAPAHLFTLGKAIRYLDKLRNLRNNYMIVPFSLYGTLKVASNNKSPFK